MPVACWLTLCAAIAFLSVPQAAYAVYFSIEGGPSKRAWSGYWWPMLSIRGWHLYDQTGPFTPLVKYGQASGNLGPLEWERKYKMTADPAHTWWGHCNGWAAATILEPDEPRQSVRVGQTLFNNGEVKGLVSAIHQGDPVDFFRGKPHWSGGDSATDLRALDFHRAVLYYLRDRKEGLIFNISAKPEVWNYPAYFFRMTGYTDSTDPRRTLVTTTLFFADNDVNPNYIGTIEFSRTYTYWVQGDPRDGNSSIAADWMRDSIRNHPQFLWHPAYARPHEPAFGEPPSGLDVEWVRRLGRTSAGVSP
jgi:hypothetical protein